VYEYVDNRVAAVTSANGNRFSLDYDTNQNLVAISDHTGRSAFFEYSTEGDLIALTDMQGYRADLTYDENHYISSITDAKGTTEFIVELSDSTTIRTSTYPAFDEPLGLSNRLTIIDPLGNKSEYFYESNNGVAWYVAPENYVDYQSDSINNSVADVAKDVYEYNSYSEGYSRISKVTYADGTWVKNTYDDNRNLSGVSYSSGQQYTITNTDTGLIQKETNELGVTTQYTYDQFNNLVQISEPNGVTSYEYNSLNQVIKQTDFKGLVTQFNYNDKGQLTSLVNAQNQTLSYEYSSEGYLSSVSISGVTIVEYGYDAEGHITSEENRFGQTKQYEYDNLNQVTRASYPGGRTTEVDYGSCPRMVSKETYPGERSYTYSYDEAKRLKSIVDPMKGQLKITRDGSGRITGLIDANQNKTTFTYDASGRLTKKTYADGSSLKRSYKTTGLINDKTNARGIVKSFIHNSVGQVTKVTYSDGTPDVSYTYDALGRVRQITDGNGNTQFSYSSTGELTEIDGPLSDDSIGFSYDDLYRIVGITVSGQDNATYSYDDLGRSNQIVAQGKTFSFNYTDSGNAKETVNYPNGITQEISIDSTGDLESIDYQKSGSSIADFGYQFDVAGDIVGLDSSEEIPFESQSFTATYNNVNQIKTYNGDSGVFDYDADGNLISGKLADGEIFTAEYDAENRLTSMSFIRDGVSIEERFSYNYNHQLVSYSRYDNGELASEKNLVRLGLLEMQERDGSDTVIAENSWRLGKPGGIGGLLLRTEGDQEYSYITNHLGHVIAVYNQSGEKVESHQFSLYGTASGDEFSLQPFGFSTKRSDFASGLVYFGYRFYAPHLGRWLNRDPLQEDGGINLYAYVNGDPMGYVDPDGQTPLFVITGAIGAAGGAAGNFVYQLARNHWNFKCVKWGDVAMAGASGAVAGAMLPFTGTTTLGAVGTGAVTNGVGYAANQAINGNSMTWAGGVNSIFWGGVGGFTSGSMSNPYWFAGRFSPIVSDAALTAANANAQATGRAIAGGALGSMDPSPSSECGCN
jgi:RHS repeat-associated protein